MNEFQLSKNLGFLNKIFTIKNLQITTIFLTGLQAGQSYSLNIYTVPQLKKIQPRSRQIQLYLEMNYKEQIKSWINLLLTSSFVYLLYRKTLNKNLLIPVLFSAIRIPITLGFMKVNWQSKKQEDCEKMNYFFKKWKQGHWVRIISDVCAFGTITFLALYNKK